MSMKDKVVLITGSSSGLGRDYAIQLAQLGAKLVITGPDSAKVTQVVQLCQEASPHNYEPIGVVADLRNPGDAERLIKVTIAGFKKLNLLVCSAVVADKCQIDDPNLVPALTKMMDINVTAVFQLTQLAIPYLEATKGSIVLDSSVAGVKPYDNWSAYCVSKAALNMVAQCLAVELGPRGIGVSSLKPEFFQTVAETSEDEVGQSRTVVDESLIEPLRISGEAQDISSAVERKVSQSNLLLELDEQFINGEDSFERSF